MHTCRVIYLHIRFNYTFVCDIIPGFRFLKRSICTHILADAKTPAFQVFSYIYLIERDYNADLSLFTVDVVQRAARGVGSTTKIGAYFAVFYFYIAMEL